MSHHCIGLHATTTNHFLTSRLEAVYFLDPRFSLAQNSNDRSLVGLCPVDSSSPVM